VSDALDEEVRRPPPARTPSRSVRPGETPTSSIDAGVSPGASSTAAGGFVRLRRIGKRFSGSDDGAAPAVGVERLDIPLGGIIAIVGSSGSGKTTLLNILGGLEAHDTPGDGRETFPDDGDRDGRSSLAPVFDIRLPGERATRRLGAPGAAASRYPRRRASYVFQQGYLLSQASIGLNLEITRRAAGLPVDTRTLEELVRFARLGGGEGERGVRKTLKDRAVTLSGGQQQRLNIARALGREPTLLFADELSSSLDPQTATDVLTALRNWVRGTDEHPFSGPHSTDGTGTCEGEGGRPSNDRSDHVPFERTRLTRTMFWVTHDYPLACRFADALIVLAPGGPMPGLVRPIELHSLEHAVTSRDIESWLRKGRVPGRVLPPASLRLSDAGDSAPPPEPSRGLGSVLANMRAGVRLSWMEAFRDVPVRARVAYAPVPTEAQGLAGLSEPIEARSPENVARPPAKGRSGVRRMLDGVGRTLRLPSRFAHRVRALQLAAVLGLVLIVTYGQEEVIGFFDAALDDPALRHVIVQQNVRELDRSVIDAASLAALSEEIESGGSTTTETSGDDAPRWGFGRFTESVDVYPEGVDAIAPGFIAEATVGILERHEPVYRELAVTPLGSGLPGCSGAADASPASLIPYADELALVVSRRYADDFSRMYGIDLCSEPSVDLWDAGAPLTFRIVGVAERLPADGYDRFDLVMQADVWRNWVSRVGKPAIGSYSRAAVYFDRQNHARVIDALRARAFAFDEEIVSKFERLLGTAASLRNTFLAITWLSLAVAVTVAAGLIWSYLSQNAKAIALLRAHDASIAPLVAAIPFQLTLTFLYSLGVLALLALAWNALAASDAAVRALASLTDGALSPAAIPWQGLVGAAPPLALTFVAMLLVGLLSLCAWHLTHPDLAHELRETE